MPHPSLTLAADILVLATACSPLIAPQIEAVSPPAGLIHRQIIITNGASIIFRGQGESSVGFTCYYGTIAASVGLGGGLWYEPSLEPGDSDGLELATNNRQILFALNGGRNTDKDCTLELAIDMSQFSGPENPSDLEKGN